jgi:Protein of unknown function (DUF2933)
VQVMEGNEMKLQHISWYVIALVAAVVGAVALGVPISTVVLLLIVLACPVTMMFMMGGHGMGGSHGSDRDADDIHRHRDSTGPS